MTWLGDPRRAKVLHDAKGPMLALRARATGRCHGLVSDTALSAYLVRPDQRSYDLADLTVRYLKRELKQGAADDDQLSLEGLDGGGDAADTAMLHARAVLDLADTLDDEIEQTRRHPAAHRGRAAAGRPAGRHGADRHRRRHRPPRVRWSPTSRARCATPPERRSAVIGKEINLGSPKQLQVVLFDELRMPKTKRTKTGYTTDADALQALYEKTEHPFLMALLRHRDVTRLRQTIEGLLKTVAPDGRIHTTFNQTDRGHRPAVEHRPQPAEHPDPHRGGPPDPRGVRRGHGLRLPADRRLQPDRDADHGPPVRGRRC